MGLAVVRVLAGNIELGGGGLSGGIEVVLVAEGISTDTGGDGILIEDDVVGVTGVVGPGNGVTLGDGHGGGVKDERT